MLVILNFATVPLNISLCVACVHYTNNDPHFHCTQLALVSCLRMHKLPINLKNCKEQTTCELHNARLEYNYRPLDTCSDREHTHVMPSTCVHSSCRLTRNITDQTW